MGGLLRTTGVLAVTVALAVGAAGCGSGDPKLTGKDKTAADHLSRSYQAQGFTAADADCLAKKWVSKIGHADMVKDGLLNKDLTTATTNKKKPTKALVDAYVDAYFSCVDYGKYEALKFNKDRPNTINQQSFAACANKIDKSDAKKAMADDLLQKSTTVSTDVTHKLIDCATGG